MLELNDKTWTDQIASTARCDLSSLTQRDLDVLDFNDKFCEAMGLLRNIPGDLGVTDSTATGSYLAALHPVIRSRISLVLPVMHRSSLATLMATAVEAQKAFDVENGFSKTSKSKSAKPFDTSPSSLLLQLTVMRMIMSRRMVLADPRLLRRGSASGLAKGQSLKRQQQSLRQHRD